MATLADVYEQARAALGDPAGDVWLNSVLFPHVQAAYREVLRVLRSAGMQRFRRQASVTALSAGATSIPALSLPTDFLRPLEIREKVSGSASVYSNMAYGQGLLPEDRTAKAKREVWGWRDGLIRTIPSTGLTDHLIQYEADLFNVTAGAQKTITGAVGSPVVFTTSTSHGLVDGDVVLVSGVVGNTSANGLWTVALASPADFTAVGSYSNGTALGGVLVGYASSTALAVDDILDAVALLTASYAARSRGQAELQDLYDKKGQAVLAQIMACESALQKAITSRWEDK